MKKIQSVAIVLLIIAIFILAYVSILRKDQVKVAFAAGPVKATLEAKGENNPKDRGQLQASSSASTKVNDPNEAQVAIRTGHQSPVVNAGPNSHVSIDYGKQNSHEH